MSTDWKDQKDDLTDLLDMIIAHVPEPPYNEGTLQLQITSIDYSSFIGRIAIGRVNRGTIINRQPVTLVKRDGSFVKTRVKELYVFEGLGKKKTEEVGCGDMLRRGGHRRI